LEKLNEELGSWIDEYHNRIHTSLGTTPLEKFTSDMSSIRPAPANLVDHFRERETRLVRRDRTVQLNSHLFEVPQGLIGKKVDLRYHADNPELVEVFFQNYSHGFAKPVDVHVNSKVGRQITINTNKKSETIEVAQEQTSKDCSGGQLFGVQEYEAHP
jgi:hypothetical protein